MLLPIIANKIRFMEALKFYTISIISNRHTDIIISTKQDFFS